MPKYKEGDGFNKKLIKTLCLTEQFWCSLIDLSIAESMNQFYLNLYGMSIGNFDTFDILLQTHSGHENDSNVMA